MQVSYGGGHARYVCVYEVIHYAGPRCQSVAARPVNRVVEALVLRVLEPSALELSVAVASDLERERAREEQLWQHRLERARYDVERARRQYDAVEPENRLVARTVERTFRSHWLKGRLEEWFVPFAPPARQSGQPKPICADTSPLPPPPLML